MTKTLKGKKTGALPDGVKTPPHSVEAEQAVLGGLMLDNTAWDKIVDKLSEEDFYRSTHRAIFRSMSDLARHGHPFDVLTVSEALKSKNMFEEAGGELYLFELAKNTPSASNITAYADIVRERSVLRQLITTSHEIAESAFYPEGAKSTELLDRAEQKIFSIAEQTARGGKTKNIESLLAAAVDRIDTLFHNQGELPGLATGFTDLDTITTGLHPADLIVIAGRPSMGKTAFSLNIAEYAAIKNEKSVLIFSMEMPGEALALRLISSWSRVDQHKIRTGQLSEEDWARITSAVSVLSKAKIFIDDTPSLSPAELRSRARRLAREQGGIDLIMIDYLQLMQVPGTRENRTTEVSEISRNLKALAKELNVPIIALSQLNRAVEQRTDKRPVMSDLRESGSIEQDADLIGFIYRDEVYNANSPKKGQAEIIIGKQRNGPIGTVTLTFLGKCTKFEDYVNEARYTTDFVPE